MGMFKFTDMGFSTMFITYILCIQDLVQIYRNTFRNRYFL